MRPAVLIAAFVAVACLLFGQPAEAGPFRSRSHSTVRTCDGPLCKATTVVRDVTRATGSVVLSAAAAVIPHGQYVHRAREVFRGSTSSAQGVAEIQASNCRMSHHGGNYAYEGVGSGPTPEAALRSCCTNGRAVVDQGVARGSDGRWYACKRYAP